MDPSRFKRRETHRRRPLTDTAFGVPDIVPRAASLRPKPTRNYETLKPLPPPVNRRDAIPEPVVAGKGVSQAKQPVSITVMTPQTRVETTDHANFVPVLRSDDMELPGQPSLTRPMQTVVR